MITLFLWQYYLIMLGFILVYFFMDVQHDTWGKFERDFLNKAAKLGTKKNKTVQDKKDLEDFRATAKKYSSKWHSIDFYIKAFVLIFIGFMSSVVLVSSTGVIFGALAVFGFTGIVMTVHAGAIRWIWHDEMWNLLNGQKFLYTGTSAKLDKIAKGMWKNILLKLGMLGFSILLIFLYINNFL